MNFFDYLKQMLGFEEKDKFDASELIDSARSKLPEPAPGMAYGQMTNERPKNYYGNKFVPEDMEGFDNVTYPSRENMAYLEENIFPQTRKAGLPDAVPAAQWAYESARGTSEDAKMRNNPWGLGPGNSYDSLEEANRVYINTVLNNSGLGEMGEDGVMRLKAGITADQLLDALAGKYEMHKENKWQSIMEQKDTPEWRYFNE